MISLTFSRISNSALLMAITSLLFFFNLMPYSHGNAVYNNVDYPVCTCSNYTECQQPLKLGPVLIASCDNLIWSTC